MHVISLILYLLLGTSKEQKEVTWSRRCYCLHWQCSCHKLQKLWISTGDRRRTDHAETTIPVQQRFPEEKSEQWDALLLTGSHLVSGIKLCLKLHKSTICLMMSKKQFGKFRSNSHLHKFCDIVMAIKLQVHWKHFYQGYLNI